jgi:hypothetical protein
MSQEDFYAIAAFDNEPVRWSVDVWMDPVDGDSIPVFVRFWPFPVGSAAEGELAVRADKFRRRSRRGYLYEFNFNGSRRIKINSALCFQHVSPLL